MYLKKEVLILLLWISFVMDVVMALAVLLVGLVLFFTGLRAEQSSKLCLFGGLGGLLGLSAIRIVDSSVSNMDAGRVAITAIIVIVLVVIILIGVLLGLVERRQKPR